MASTWTAGIPAKCSELGTASVSVVCGSWVLGEISSWMRPKGLSASFAATLVVPAREIRRCHRSVRAVDVRAMVDIENVDRSSRFVDAVHDSIRATQGAVATGERPEQWLADSLRVVGQRTVAELQHGRRHRLRKPSADRAPGGRLESDLVALA